jgi:large subunit ribosomal protein LP1
MALAAMTPNFRVIFCRVGVNILILCFYFQGEKIQTILKAANVDVEPYWPGLFAKALEGVNVKDLITSIGSGAGSGPAAGPAAASAAAPAAAEKKEEAKKEESENESDDDMGFGLFE